MIAGAISHREIGRVCVSCYCTQELCMCIQECTFLPGVCFLGLTCARGSNSQHWLGVQVARFLVVHGQIMLHQFKNFQVRTIRECAFISELQERMSQGVTPSCSCQSVTSPSLPSQSYYLGDLHRLQRGKTLDVVGACAKMTNMCPELEHFFRERVHHTPYV